MEKDNLGDEILKVLDTYNSPIPAEVIQYCLVMRGARKSLDDVKKRLTNLVDNDIIVLSHQNTSGSFADTYSLKEN